MIVDAYLRFSNAQDISGAASGSTNTIDLSEARNVAVGKELFIVVVVTTAFTDAGNDSTVAVALEGDSTDTFTPDSTEPLFTIAALAAIGDTYIARIPFDKMNLRYGRLKYTPANGNLTAGNVTAFVTQDIQKYIAYAKNYTITD
jgi:hypothetical protein